MSLGRRVSFGVLVAFVAAAIVGIGVPRARADAPLCEYQPPALLSGDNPLVVDCLPSPTDCALGRAPLKAVRATAPEAVVECVGGGGQIGYYAAAVNAQAGANPICGLTAANDRLLATTDLHSWFDPNECIPVPPGRPGKGSRFRPAATGSQGAVASISPEASKAGLEMLQRGGNAIDAAVATVFAVGVTSPENCGIGGGGFLIARTADGEVRALDFRETAPAAVTNAGVLFNGPEPKEEIGPRIAGVPGVVAGMAAALQELGTKPLADTLASAIGLARDGIIVSPDLARAYGPNISDPQATKKTNVQKLGGFEASRDIYLQTDGATYYGYHPGATLEQTDYAASLELIAKEGPDAFYRGRIAQQIVAAMEASQTRPEPGLRGLMTADDLANYRPIWREPLKTTYRGHEILALPAPDAGGIQVVEALNILEGYAMGTEGWKHGSVNWAHHVAEAQKIAFVDRLAYVGDPAFVDVPSQLTSKGYAAQRRFEITEWGDTPYEPGQFGRTLPPTPASAADGTHTTHVSAIDRWGNAVAVTCTIEKEFGSGFVAPGTGFLLNGELWDFDQSDGGPNAPAPGKRPASSMAPVLVAKGGRVVLATGGAGGKAIPGAVLNSIVNVVDFGMPIDAAVDAARVQATAERRTILEPGRLPGLKSALTDKKHTFSNLPGDEYVLNYRMAVLQAVGDSGAQKRASSDPRARAIGAAAL